MNDTYIEEGVKCRDTSQNMLIRIGLVAGTVFSFLLVLIIPYLIIVPFLMILLSAFIFSRLKAEFEYIYADGQIDFDRIRGNAKRKTLLRVDIEQVEIIAPTRSNEIQNFSRNGGMKVRDFTSFDPEAKTFSMILRKDGETMKIMFEPSERLIKSMKRKQPRKVVEY